MTFDELLKWLYKAGTGWLGWSPETVMSAHMQEIILAYEGLTEKLQAIHGSNEKGKQTSASGHKGKGGVNKEFFDAAFGIG